MGTVSQQFSVTEGQQVITVRYESGPYPQDLQVVFGCQTVILFHVPSQTFALHLYNEAG